MKERILAIVRTIKSDKTLNERTHLVYDGVLSSLEILMLISELEREFSVKIPVEEVLPDNFDTADGIAKLIEGLTGRQNPS